MKILVIAEHDQMVLKNATYHTLSAALELGSDIDMLVMGDACQVVCDAAAKCHGVKRVLNAEAPAYAHQLAESCAPLLASLAPSYTHILAPATTFGKNLLPRVAALLNMAMVGDVIQILAPDEFIRPIHAGNALATVQSLDPIKLLTVRSTAFAVSPVDNQNAKIEKITPVFSNDLSRFVSEELSQSARPELTSAKIIIAGGRGLKNTENFKLLEKLADQLGAAIGASRAAVDAGFAPNDYQIGQTGKIVAPELYIAVGISGAIQHLAGMKDSKVIVAINNDPDAPIFQIADYGLVTDLFSALQELTTELEKNN
jgi:electron transfer flavoprotein alpha subunit